MKMVFLLMQFQSLLTLFLKVLPYVFLLFLRAILFCLLVKFFSRDSRIIWLLA